METKIIEIDGVSLIAPAGWDPVSESLDVFPDCCGAGNGLGEKLVPEKILGLRISAACNIHDYDFTFAPATWSAFHAANFRFVRNIYAIIEAKSKWGTGLLRTAIASVYFYSVDTKGAEVFRRLKASEGEEVV